MVSLRKAALTGALALGGAAGFLFAANAWQTQSAAPAPMVKLDAHRTLGRPQAFRNLTLIPVTDRSARPTDTYLTLDEGLKQKLVTVREAKSGGTVNTLYVTNESQKPLYLMGGEVVLGGQQDRTLGRDLIIPPGAKDVAVTVFCVEHGRWNGHADFEASAPTVASSEIRNKAQNGQFYAERAVIAGRAGPGSSAVSGPSDQGGRSAGNRAINRRGFGGDGQAAAGAQAVGQAQQEVWDTVARKNSKLKTGSSTGSYRNALNLAGGEAQKSVPLYLNALQNSLSADRHLVGVVAAINGKVVAADIFGDPVLFRKLWPKLLRSYASDAVEHFEDPTRLSTVTAAQAKEFLLAATDAKSKTENKSDVSTTLRYESSQAVTFSLVPGAKAGATPFGGMSGYGGGGFGGGAAVHTGVLGK